MGNIDRRRHPRVDLSVAVDITSDHNFYAGRTRDISMGGLFIEADVGLAVGTPLCVHIDLAGQKIAADVEVAWVLLGDGDAVVGFGVRFLTLAPKARRTIERFMIRRDPMSF